MTPEQTHLWLEIQHRQMVALERIADSISAIAPVSTAAPNYQRPLETFARFDWESIGATVERSDQYGAAVVSWRGLQFVRRSPSNKFKEIIFFSRCVGKDDDGNNKYERLISFKAVSKVEVEPLPDKVTRFVAGADHF
jgi:hypothetical protein